MDPRKASASSWCRLSGEEGVIVSTCVKQGGNQRKVECKDTIAVLYKQVKAVTANVALISLSDMGRTAPPTSYTAGTLRCPPLARTLWQGEERSTLTRLLNFTEIRAGEGGGGERVGEDNGKDEGGRSKEKEYAHCLKNAFTSLAPSTLTYHAPSSPTRAAPRTAARALPWQLAAPVAQEHVRAGAHGELEEAQVPPARGFVELCGDPSARAEVARPAPAPAPAHAAGTTQTAPQASPHPHPGHSREGREDMRPQQRAVLRVEEAVRVVEHPCYLAPPPTVPAPTAHTRAVRPDASRSNVLYAVLLEEEVDLARAPEEAARCRGVVREQGGWAPLGEMARCERRRVTVSTGEEELLV
ncbi:hypothetical protein B0H14DRAFT_3881256 [Mycena olivaceomarginata]|nr:hypothetical protein B0H14DRAFT_3881256 [Mycena olivaceomarginata]